MGRPKKDMNIGRRIGFIRVLAYDKRSNQYECLCDCGTVCFFPRAQILKGTAKACESCRGKLPSRAKDISGNQYGVLSVKFPYVQDNGETKRLWVCECNVCGKDSLHKAGALKAGIDYACPHCGAGKRRREQQRIGFGLTGRTFGDFTVKRKVVDGWAGKSDEWVCTCSCGYDTVLSRKELLGSEPPGCPCCSQKKSKAAVGWVWRAPADMQPVPDACRAVS